MRGYSPYGVVWATSGGRKFTKQLFEVVRPQRRKEGMTAATALTVAGEFDANIPAPEWRVKEYAEKGAPLGYHCPAPVPITVSQIVMLDKSPHKNGARLFINWILSRGATIAVRRFIRCPRSRGASVIPIRALF